MSLTAVSLFASAGIGDLALRANDVDVLVANELIPERANLFAANYPDTLMLVGDVWRLKDDIISASRDALLGRELDIVLATPPCQGMSKNGQGKLLRGIRDGYRPLLDPRNRLIIPTLDIVKSLNPRLVIFENVPEMQNTIIEDENGDAVTILEFIERELAPGYRGEARVIEFADYGVPQRRQRLITIYTRDERVLDQYDATGSLHPMGSHSEQGTIFTAPWVTVRDVIGNLPPLSGRSDAEAVSDFSPLHRVPVLDPKKYEWIKHTPPGRGAFDNQCVNVECGFQGNATHGSRRDAHGVNRASEVTPLYCAECGHLLPRPFVLRGGQLEIMKGFTSAYRRMAWDRPAPTLTTNLSYPSSDQNVHPDQHRVLSLYEALALHTVLDFSFNWTYSDGRPVPDSLIRESIGESVPPRGLAVIVEYVVGALARASSGPYELEGISEP